MMIAESSAGTDVGTFLSRCKPLRDIAEGTKKLSAVDEKNFFWCAGHLSRILVGYRVGLLVPGDLNFAKSKSICPPENSADAVPDHRGAPGNGGARNRRINDAGNRRHCDPFR
jgi:hypothetical protein